MATKRDNEVYWIANRDRKTVELLDRDYFPCFEAVSACFRCGFQMRDGQSANAIGRSRSLSWFRKAVENSGYTLLTYS